MLSKYKKIIIFLLVLVLIFVIWLVFVREEKQPESLLLVEEKSETEVLGQDIINTLQRIQTIKLEKKVFENKVLLRLEDYSRKININTVGRPNPFEVISQSSSPSSSSGSNNIMLNNPN